MMQAYDIDHIPMPWPGPNTLQVLTYLLPRQTTTTAVRVPASAYAGYAVMTIPVVAHMQSVVVWRDHCDYLT